MSFMLMDTRYFVARLFFSTDVVSLITHFVGLSSQVSFMLKPCEGGSNVINNARQAL